MEWRTKKFAAAAEFLAALPPETRASHAKELVPLELQAAAQLKTLDQRIEEYRAMSSIGGWPMKLTNRS